VLKALKEKDKNQRAFWPYFRTEKMNSWKYKSDQFTRICHYVSFLSFV